MKVNGQHHFAIPRKRLGYFFLIPLLLAFGVMAMLASEWKESLTVEKISAGGLQNISSRELVTLSGIPAGAKMYGIHLSDIRANLMKHPFVKWANVRRVLPGTVHVDIVEREPVASLNIGQLLYVDADRVVLPGSGGQKKFDVPLIIGIDGLTGQKPGSVILNKELAKALEVLSEAASIDSTVYHLISEVDMNHGGDIILNAVDTGVPVTLGREDIGKKLRLFEAFWARYVVGNEAERLERVDLRFEDQVVVKWYHQSAAPQKKTAL